MPIHHVRDYVEHLKGQPVHVRKRFALGASGAITGVIALAWIVALSSSGSLTLAPSSSATSNIAAATRDSGKDLSSLLGAAGAFKDNGFNGSGSITVVDTKASSTLDQPATASDERTVIPF